MADPIEGEEHGPFRSVPFVAARIGWHERTIRRHCVSVIEWVAAQRESGLSVLGYTERTGDIPALKLGALWRVPTWWLVAVLEAGRPSEPSSDQD